MDSISERVDIALYTEGQIRLNKVLIILQRNTVI